MKIFAPHATDFYKTGHPAQNPEGTEIIYANMTARSDRLANMPSDFDHKVVVANIQGTMEWLLKDLWNDSFFHQPKAKVLEKYKRRMDSSLGVGVVGIDHFAELHDLGYLPLHIKALPEGSRVNIGVPFLTAQNTHRDFKWMAPWTTNYIETAKSSEIWKAVNVATIAYEFRRLLDRYADLTGSNPQFVDFQGHDFSARGLSGIHDAAAHQIGHLYSFKGTDTILSIDYLEDYYDCGSEFIGGSVPATEHSVTCLGGKENELETIRRIITKVYPKGIVSVVSDTWNYWDMLTVIAPALKDEILSRQPNELGLAKVTFRPDCYDQETQIFTSEGWKYFSELDEDSRVAQVSDDEKFDFVKPTKIVWEKYSGEMIKFYDSKGKLDLLVTPNHRMIFKQNGRLKVEEASASKVGLWGKDFLRCVPYCDDNADQSKLTPHERLAIAFQADGSYYSNHKSAVRFSFAKQRKIDRLTSILEECGLKYKIYPLSKNPKYPYHSSRVEISVSVNPNSLKKDFSWVPSAPSSEWAKEFIEELSYWDSTRRSEFRFKVDTTDPEVAKVIEKVALFAGYGCKLTVYPDKRKDIFSDVYTLHILKSNILGGKSIKKISVDYDGYIGCVQVPTGRVLVRRNGVTIVSGNSGDPEKIICGNPDVAPGSPEFKGSLELLWETFGGTVNEKGYKVLNPRVGLIYGDSITLSRAMSILERMRQQGWASENIVFGIGSYTYQYHTRDTYGIAYKTTWGQINGVPIETMKDPITDRGTKKSAKGLLRVEKEGDNFVLYQQQTREQEQQGALQTVFLNSVVYGRDVNSLTNIRGRLLS